MCKKLTIAIMVCIVIAFFCIAFSGNVGLPASVVYVNCEHGYNAHEGTEFIGISPAKE